MDYIITCCTKGPTCQHGYQHVERVGFRYIPMGGGTVYYAPRAEMVERLENGQTAITQGRDGMQAQVVVRRCACGIKYLTTKPDASKQNNLLELVSC